MYKVLISKGEGSLVAKPNYEKFFNFFEKICVFDKIRMLDKSNTKKHAKKIKKIEFTPKRPYYFFKQKFDVSLFLDKKSKIILSSNLVTSHIYWLKRPSPEIKLSCKCLSTFVSD